MTLAPLDAFNLAATTRNIYSPPSGPCCMNRRSPTLKTRQYNKPGKLGILLLPLLWPLQNDSMDGWDKPSTRRHMVGRIRLALLADNPLHSFAPFYVSSCKHAIVSLPYPLRHPILERLSRPLLGAGGYLPLLLHEGPVLISRNGTTP